MEDPHRYQVKGNDAIYFVRIDIDHISSFRVGAHAPRFCVAESRCENDRSERTTSDSHTPTQCQSSEDKLMPWLTMAHHGRFDQGAEIRILVL